MSHNNLGYEPQILKPEYLRAYALPQEESPQ